MKKILILTANPTNTKPLRLSEEIRDIKNACERSQNREQFEIIVEEAVRPQEFRRTLLGHKPNIVHFSGHGGGEQGLALMADNGEAFLVKVAPLAKLFKALQEIFFIDCVFLARWFVGLVAEIAHTMVFCFGRPPCARESPGMNSMVYSCRQPGAVLQRHGVFHRPSGHLSN
jgi:hypothetical protein